MNGNCHFIFGASVAVLSATLLKCDATETALMVSSCLIGSVFPDMDNPKSNFGQLTKPLSTIIGKIHKATGRKEYEHRGILHSLFLNGTGLALSWFFFPYLKGFFIGTLSHLLLDMFNPAGIPLLTGLGGLNRISIAKIYSSDTKACSVITWLLTFIAIAVTIYLRLFV